MPVTLSDEQVAQIRAQLEEGQRHKAVAEFAQSIWNDPKLSDEAKALAKRKYPDAQIPDYDIRKEVNDRFEKERVAREEADKKRKEEEQTAFYTKQRQSVQEEYGFTDDAMQRMEKEMNERRVYDYEAMAPFFASKEPKPIENTQHNHFWNHSKQDSFKQIIDDPEGYAMNELVRAVDQDARARNMR